MSYDFDFNSLTGWKLGWAYGPPALIKNLCVAHQNCSYMCQTPEQEAVAIALENQVKLLKNNQKESTFFHKQILELTSKREEWASTLKAVGISPILPQGGYFMIAEWTPLINSPCTI